MMRSGAVPAPRSGMIVFAADALIGATAKFIPQLDVPPLYRSAYVRSPMVTLNS